MNRSINSQKYQNLASWLKAARLEKNLTVRGLATLIDEPFQFVSKVETCQRRLNVYEYVQYCEALEIRPEDGLVLLNSR